LRPDFEQLRLAESPDATIIIGLDGKIVYWSQGAESLFEYSDQEAIGQFFADLVVPAEFQEEEKRLLKEIVVTGGRTYEASRRRKNGSYINVLVSSKTILDASGAPEYIISTKADVTDLIVQRDAKVVEAKFRDLLESTPDSIIMTNPTGRIVLANSQAENLFGYDHGELIGQPVELLLPSRFRSGHLGFRTKYLADPRPRLIGAGLELAGLRKDGIEFPVEISLSPLITGDSTLVMSAIRDITQRKKIEQALYDKNLELLGAAEAKNRFLANMSHELRTPLNGIIGFAEFLVDGKPGALNSKQEEYLTDILNCGRHLLQLINDVLDLAKVESGKMEFFPELFSVLKAVSEVCAVVAPVASKKAVSFTLDVDADADIVKLDVQKTKQILYNLISNAVKFSNDKGQVQIRAAIGDDRRLILSVRDFGIGIGPEDLGRLFKEFQQLDSGAARRYEGTGLGLALTRKIVELQGGSIDVESQLGVGSTFVVTIGSGMEGSTH